MTFVPQHYVPDEVKLSFATYYRRDDGSLAHIKADNVQSHKEAILLVKETLVTEGDGLDKKAILAVIKGGKE
jgi:hypothetical protein